MSEIKPIEGLTDEEWQAFDAAINPPPEPPCLLPDDDTAVERLAAAIPNGRRWVRSADGHTLVYYPKDNYAAAIIAALREGGQR